MDTQRLDGDEHLVGFEQQLYLRQPVMVPVMSLENIL